MAEDQLVFCEEEEKRPAETRKEKKKSPEFRAARRSCQAHTESPETSSQKSGCLPQVPRTGPGETPLVFSHLVENKTKHKTQNTKYKTKKMLYFMQESAAFPFNNMTT